jgi:hypothetical protein
MRSYPAPVELPFGEIRLSRISPMRFARGVDRAAFGEIRLSFDSMAEEPIVLIFDGS